MLDFLSHFSFVEYLAAKVGDYLTASSGIQIRYATAHGTSLFKEGMIRLKKYKILHLIISNTYSCRVVIYRPPPVGEENHSVIDLTVEELEVKLSLLWLLQGRGLVQEAVIKGVRGTIDRRTERYDPNWTPTRRRWQARKEQPQLLILLSERRFRVEQAYSIGCPPVILVILGDYNQCNCVLSSPDPTFRPWSISIFTLDCDLMRLVPFFPF